MGLKKLLLLSLIFFNFSCAAPKPDTDDNPSTSTDIFNITSQGDFTCARYKQKIKCWGENVGRLGVGSSSSYLGGTQSDMDKIDYVNLGDDFSIIDIKSGENHTCALSAAGDVKCWGNTNEGYLGQKNKQLIGSDSEQMGDALDKINLGDNFSVTKLFDGGACAQIQSGDVKCWGNNDMGLLGRGDATTDIGFVENTMGNSLPKIDLGASFDVKKIVTSYSNACALNQIGEMKCWGSNLTGILGDAYSDHVGDSSDEMGNKLKIIDLGSEFTVSDFDLLGANVCAVSTAGKLLCWGDNEYGQLGQGHIRTLGKNANELGDTLTEINLGFTVKQVQIGETHICALSTDGNVKCWGGNGAGQLGYGDTNTRGNIESGDYSIDSLNNVDLGTDFKINYIELGLYHSCAVSSKYEIKCWGRGDEKQILTEEDGNKVGDQSGDMGNNLKTMVLFDDEAI